ncbi:MULTISPECIES: hypothetical protein [unclassified Curtobacterium]|uniref:hypothetical protein n=1 Tax=unclassified Curtobacterium TaxID=257496 RepID=UPI000D8DED5B|nr:MULTISPECIES: hypothetical protein [unclassified Curtobacterium]PYY63424.1 hypothetical protein DEJ30_13335 [Curtobacterium sp. MCPF17_003]PZE64683.1 hypothetical protein DEJ27_15620 [Curtobacterium sp. MCPF17_018]PZF27906.1 hypothetical protein DEJ35_13270 [Curtobacterium sp. MCPF17_051]WIB69369.1 hypothetical protein DEI85_09290 [Curtobacterium sp. MCBD17_026]
MSTRAKTVTALFGAATVALLLTACDPGGAQNINPVGKVPGSEEKSQSAQCDVAASAAVDMIDKAVGSHDTTEFANIQKGDGGWYLGAAIVPADSNDSNDDEVTIWATTADPTADDFDGPLYAVNDIAKQAVADETTTTSDAPTPFADDSKAAEQVESCVVEASDR